MRRVRKKASLWIVVMLLSIVMTGCGSAEEASSGKESYSNQIKIYNGKTKIRTPYGNWTPPKGSRRLENGTIVDAEGCVIGNDGTWHDTGRGVG